MEEREKPAAQEWCVCQVAPFRSRRYRTGDLLALKVESEAASRRLALSRYFGRFFRRKFRKLADMMPSISAFL